MLSFRFDDTREAFREALGRFIRDRVAPGYRDRAAKDVYPMELHRDLAEMGVLGIGLPEEFGGTGPEDPLTLGIACEELGAGDPNLAAAPVQTGLIGTQIAKGGTPTVRRRWLPPSSKASPWPPSP
jgi:Acyl-CoA dehydrogenases